jgi:predicted permease
MRDWWGDLRHAWRRLRRAPAFTVFSVVTLALGIGATTAVYSAVYAAILRPPDLPNVSEVANLYHSDPRGGASGLGSIAFSRADFDDYRAAQTSFQFVAAWTRFRLPFSANGRTDFLMGEAVGGDYFAVVGIHAALGRVIQRDDDRPSATPVIVLSDTVWRTRFDGDPAIVGKTARLGDTTFEIVGVMAPSFHGVDMPTVLPTAAWIPLSMMPDAQAANLLDRERRILMAKGRLQPGRTMAQAQAELTAIAQRLDLAYPIGRGVGSRFPAAYKARRWFLMPAANVKMHESLDRLARPLAATIMLSVCLVLLVACTNVANLVLTRNTARRHETAVRLALGATRWRIVREQLAEAALVTVMGGAAALVLAQVLIARVLRSEVPIVPGLSARISPEINLPVAAAAVASTVLALIVFGVIPAFHGTRRGVRDAIASDGHSGSLPRWRGRRALIACQVTVSAGLVSIAVLCAQQLLAVARHDTGLDIDRLALVRVSLPSARYDEPRARRVLDEIVDSAARLPGVESAAVSSGFPVEMGSSLGGQIARTPDQLAGGHYEFMIAAPGVFRTWGIPTLEGRTFDGRDTAGSEPVLVLTQRLARTLFPEGSAVGHQVVLRYQQMAGEPVPAIRAATVVGVVADTDFGDRGNRGYGAVYLPWTQHYRSTMAVSVRTAADPAALVDALRQIVNRIDSNVPVMDAETAASLGGGSALIVRIGAVASGLLGGLALILAMAGLYGVLSEAVLRRTREMGIRMALGADAYRLRRMVLVDGVRPVIVGLAIGLGCGMILRVAFRPMFIRMLPAFDPIVFLVVPAAFIAASLLAAYLPARHASRVDPNVALRHL